MSCLYFQGLSLSNIYQYSVPFLKLVIVSFTNSLQHRICFYTALLLKLRDCIAECLHSNLQTQKKIFSNKFTRSNLFS
ncbi:hypothetical protein LWI28_021953 [Acer negundo]|uniref:Uncharacterized protein n=1 Tax=Acer negundo TaxID=4023 RepID=A0AAD5J1I3_ACENE|nr:hypothetical protein LWI28_021953 [Acer negundo]